MRGLAAFILALALISFVAGWAHAEQAPHARQPELQVLCWKIYYSGSTVTCRQSTWDAAPRDDVQVVVVWYGKTYQTFSNGRWVTENYRHVCAVEDYYWLDGCGSADDAAEYRGRNAIKTGRWTTNANFRRIYQKAYDDVRPPR